MIDTLGYVQTKEVESDTKATTTVNCATWSSRTDTADGFAYKIGDKVMVKSGYKVRADATAK